MESATHEDTAAKVGDAADNGDRQPEAATSFDVHRPVDGSVITSVAIDSESGVAESVARARAAQPAWEAIGFDGRRRWMEELRDWILANQDRLDAMMQEETGKVRADAALEAFYCLDAINFWVDHGPKLLADEIVTPHVPLLRAKRSKIVYRPLPTDDPKQRRPDITRARTLLNWEPKVALEEGLLKTVDYFKQRV